MALCEGVVADVEALSDQSFVLNPFVPSKIALFAWRLFQTRLTTNDYLFYRQIIQNKLCGLACDEI